jgi:hypothetical protein
LGLGKWLLVSGCLVAWLLGCLGFGPDSYLDGDKGFDLMNCGFVEKLKGVFTFLILSYI